jgi:hypothetical protein
VRRARHQPNEFWHIDVTLFQLLDGSRVDLHAAIDNFSRRILAWKVAERLEPRTTCAVLVEAAKSLPTERLTPSATVVADSGVENINGEADALLALGQLKIGGVLSPDDRRRPINSYLLTPAKRRTKPAIVRTASYGTWCDP